MRSHGKIVLHGCYHTSNFGDMLLLDLAAQYMVKRFGRQPVCPWLTDEQAPFVSAQKGRGLRDMLNCDVLIFGGGGYLNCRSSVRHQLRLLRYVVPGLIAALRGKPIGIFGVGVGPSLAGLGRSFARLLCALSQTVCVRDDESAALLAAVGVPLSETETTADLAFALESRQIPAESLALARTLLPRRDDVKYVGLHLSSLPPGRAQSFILQTLDMAAALLEDCPQIVPVWVIDHGEPYLDVIKEYQREKLRNLVVLPQSPHWDTVALLGQLNYVITTKLHVGLVAFVLGAMPFGISNHGKTKRFFRQIGREQFQRDITLENSDIDAMREWLEQIRDDDPRVNEHAMGAREQLASLARRNLDKLTDLIG